MSLPALDNLVRICRLKAEPINEAEVMRMLARVDRSNPTKTMNKAATRADRIELS